MTTGIIEDVINIIEAHITRLEKGPLLTGKPGKRVYRVITDSKKVIDTLKKNPEMTHKELKSVLAWLSGKIEDNINVLRFYHSTLRNRMKAVCNRERINRAYNNYHHTAYLYKRRERLRR